jgi:hypothetical protein
MPPASFSQASYADWNVLQSAQTEFGCAHFID